MDHQSRGPKGQGTLALIIQRVWFNVDLNTHDTVATYTGQEIGRYSFLSISETESPDDTWSDFNTWQLSMVSKAKDILNKGNHD